MCYLTMLSIPEQCRNLPSAQDSGQEMCAVMRVNHLVKFTFYMSDFDQNWNGMKFMKICSTGLLLLSYMLQTDGRSDFVTRFARM